MTFETRDLGRMSYEDAVAVQREVLDAVVAGERDSTLLLVEHDPVITLGAGFHEENLCYSRDGYAERGIEIAVTDRGGDVTYHGPGQLVAYPIFRLDAFDRDLHRYLRFLEEVAIQTCAHFGLESGRNPVNTGVWIGPRKICAIGIKVRRWVSMHGLALNCDLDLTPFSTIIPCGIRGGFGVTSLSQELGRQVTIAEAKPVLVDAAQGLLRSAAFD